MLEIYGETKKKICESKKEIHKIKKWFKKFTKWFKEFAETMTKKEFINLNQENNFTNQNWTIRNFLIVQNKRNSQP